MTREYLLFSFLRTRQMVVYDRRMEFYRELIRNQVPIDEEPQELITAKSCGDDWELGNGNHRAYAMFLEGEPGIEVTTNLDSERYRIKGSLRPISELEVLPGDRLGNNLPDLETYLRKKKQPGSFS